MKSKRMSYTPGITVVVFLSLGVLTGCSNNPYPEDALNGNTLFTAFTAPIIDLDPVTSYASHELDVTCNIVESPFAYEYLKRPYELIPLLAEEIPKPVYLDKNGRVLPADAPLDLIDRVEYTIRIRKGIKYAPHPCFAKDKDGKFLYHNLTYEDVKNIDSPLDLPFDLSATREMTAEDFVLEFRRQLDPILIAPLKAVLEQRIVGALEATKEFKRSIDEERERRKKAAGYGYRKDEDERLNPIVVDYMKPEFEGLELIDRYTYKIALRHPYPQILYWMAMTFMCPMPQEALDFYRQRPLLEKEIYLRTWPVGTGPYYVAINKPQERIQLKVNPFFKERGETYPTQGEPGDEELGLLADAGKPVPFIDTIEMVMEKEAIPLWNKFQQGYYDTPVMTTDVDVNTINMATKGGYDLSEDLKKKGIRMSYSVGLGITGFGFNIHDEVVGGLSEEKCKLRQAISIAINYEEYVNIFMNGRAVPAMGPLPPGIPGYKPGKEGINPYTHYWDEKQNMAVRKPIEEARRLLAEAGYPGGYDKDGSRLVLYLDHYRGGRPEFNSEFEWYRQKLALLGVELVQRGTDAKRFWEKVGLGNWQCAFFGWSADYPDPENFFFLWSRPPEDVADEGVVRATYDREEYHQLYQKMEAIENGPERLAITDRMVELLRHDAPWVWSIHGKEYGLQHEWSLNTKYNPLNKGSLKYRKIDSELRRQRIREWNKPNYTAPVILLLLALGGIIPGVVMQHRKEKK